MFGNSVTTAMTDQQTSNATDAILRELMDCVSSLKEDVAELKKRNDDATATSAMESRKRPRDGDAGADLRDSITRDGEDDRSQQYSGDGDSDSDPAGGTDSEDYICLVYGFIFLFCVCVRTLQFIILNITPFEQLPTYLGHMCILDTYWRFLVGLKTQGRSSVTN